MAGALKLAQFTSQTFARRRVSWVFAAALCTLAYLADEGRSESAAAAAVTTPAPTPTAAPDPFAHPSTFGTFLLFSGAVFGGVCVFFGYRIFRAVFFAVGFLAGFTVFYVFAPASINTSFCCGTKAEHEWPHILFSALVGVVGGCAALFIVRLGMFLVGAVSGLVSAIFVLATPIGTQDFLESNLGVGLFYAGFALAGGLLACAVEKLMIILTTSVAGAFAVMMGLDYWVKSDLTRVINVLFSRVEAAIKNDFSSGKHAGLSMAGISIHGKTWGMLAGWAVLAAIGIACQFNVTGKHVDHRAPRGRKGRAGGRRGSMQEPLLENDRRGAGVV